MVANSPIERVGQGQVDYLLNRLNDIERRLNEGGARSSFPFSVGHLGITDFQIIQSTSGDGSADVYIGNGAGGKLIQITTDVTYGTKIIRLMDQSGTTMLATDAAAGFGLGVPSLPFVYAGTTWNQTLAGATSQGTAKEIGRGLNYVYNPATLLNPIVRIASSTAETVKIFCQFRDGQANLNITAEATLSVTAGGTNLDTNTCQFGKLWQADDMNVSCAAFIKAYCTTANPGNVNIQMTYGQGQGLSQAFYNQFAPTWQV